MVEITFSAGKYIEQLAKRMRAANPPISQAELARTMGISATQATRWFTENPARRREPSLGTIERIEAAMAKLERQRARKAAK
jgi:transcriptional regulator with XRE-family HTH domain